MMLLAIAEPFPIDAEFLKDRQIDIASGLAFANHMSTVICANPALPQGAQGISLPLCGPLF